MSTRKLIVGNEGCPIQRIIIILQSSETLGQFHGKWSDIARELGVDSASVKKIRDDKIQNKLQLSDVLHEIIEKWVGQEGKDATFAKLIQILEINGLKNCAELLVKEFTPNSSPLCDSTQIRKYCRIPTELEAFLEAAKLTDKTKSTTSLFILTSIDIGITCGKLVENVQSGLVIHEFKEFLDIISSHKVIEVGHVLAVKATTSPNLKQVIQIASDKHVLVKCAIIAITLKDNERTLIEHIKLYPSLKNIVQLGEDTMKWNDLTPSHKHELVKRLETKLHMNLEDVDLSEIIHGQLLADLINGNELKLFKNNLPTEISYYVGRTILPRSQISSKIIEECSMDILLFTGMSRYELSNLASGKMTDSSTCQLGMTKFTVKHMLLDQPNHFYKICNRSPYPVHLFQYAQGILRWIQSNGSIKVVQKYVEKCTQEFNEQDIILLSNSSHPVIISDSPGMGKSSLLGHIGRELARVYPERKVFFLIFSEFIKQIKQTGTDDVSLSLRMAMDHLICENALGGAVLKHKLNLDIISVELLLDGFDELDSNDFTLACTVLKLISSCKSIHLWVTSRPHLLEELESSLNTLGYNIKPFDISNQTNFLTSYWSRENSLLDQLRLKCFASECLSVINKHMESKDRDIAGIPLQCLLLGDVYEEEAVSFASSEQSLLPTILLNSITTLYQSVIAMKFTKYLVVHVRSDFCGTETLTDGHVSLSIQLIFQSYFENLKGLVITGTDSCLEELLKVGILESSSLTGTPRFTHRTFAEYFVALFIVERLLRGGEWEDAFTCFLIEGVLVRKLKSFVKYDYDATYTDSNFVEDDKFKLPGFDHHVIAYFLDGLLANRLHVIPSEINSLRSIHHAEDMIQIARACAFTNFGNILNLLEAVKAFDVCPSKIFDGEFLTLAIRFSGMELILEGFRKFEEHHRLELELQTKLLQFAVRRGQYSIVEFLIKCKGLRVIVEDMNEDPRMLLHDLMGYTAIDQRVQILRMLVEINQGLLESRDKRGRTPIFTYGAHVRLRVELIKLGSNLLPRDNEKGSIIHDVYHFTPDDYQALVTSIPENVLRKLVRIEDHKGHTPLVNVIQHLTPTVETLHRFKDVGADFNSPDECNIPVLARAISHQRDKSVLKHLIKLGANVNWKSPRYGSSDTLLDVSIKCKNTEALVILLGEHGDTFKDIVKYNCNKLIHTAAECGHADGIAHLLEEYGKIFMPILKSEESLLLHVAAFNGHVDSIKVLLHHGADVNVMDKMKNTALQYDVKFEFHKDYFSITKQLLDCGANPNLKNVFQNTPLDTALINEVDIETIRLLKSKTNTKLRKRTTSIAQLELVTVLEKEGESAQEEFNLLMQDFKKNGVVVNVDSIGNTLLHCAIDRNYEKAVQFIVQGMQMDVNSVNILHETALHRAASRAERDAEASVNMIKYLIDNGATPDARDCANHTFLHICTMFLWPDCLHDLAEYLTKSNLSSLFNLLGGDSAQFTPLQQTLSALKPTEETLCLLHSSGVDFNATDTEGFTVLAYAVKGRKSRTTLTTLIERFGADPKYIGRLKWNMLHVAASYCTAESLKMLMDLGNLSVNEKDFIENTPLHLVLQPNTKNIDILEKCTLLVDNGADVNSTNIQKETPFLLAAHIKPHDLCLKVTRLFVEGGANVSECNLTFLHHYILRNEPPSPLELHSMIEYLLGRNKLRIILLVKAGECEWTPLHVAVSRMELEEKTLQMIHDNGLNFNAVDRNGNSILWYAIAGKRSPKFISRLIHYDSDVNMLNNKGQSMLHVSANLGTVDSLKIILDLGELDVNRIDQNGCTPLHCIGNDNAVEKSKLLVEHGADVNIVNKSGRTPLEQAMRNNYRDKELLLILGKLG